MKAFFYIIFILLSLHINAQSYTVKIAGMPPGNVDYTAAKMASGLTVDGPGNPEIMQFRITYFSEGFENMLTSYSSQFTKDQTEAIKKLLRRQVLYVDKIRIKTDDKILDLPGVSFKLSTFAGWNYTTLCGLKGGNITVNTIKSDPELRVIDINGTITSFSMSFNSSIDIEYTSKSNKLTKDMLSGLSRIKRGQRLLFYKIIIKKDDGTSIKANDLMFKIM